MTIFVSPLKMFGNFGRFFSASKRNRYQTPNVSNRKWLVLPVDVWCMVYSYSPRTHKISNPINIMLFDDENHTSNERKKEEKRAANLEINSNKSQIYCKYYVYGKIWMGSLSAACSQWQFGDIFLGICLFSRKIKWKQETSKEYSILKSIVTN